MGTPTCTFDRASIEQNELAKQLYYLLFNETKVSCEEMDIGYSVFKGGITEFGTYSQTGKIEKRGTADYKVTDDEVIEYSLLNYDKFREQILQKTDNTKLTDALYRKGGLSLFAKDYDTALRFFNYSLELNPNRADIISDLGLISKDQGNLDDAIAKFNQSIQIDPSQTKTYLHRGVIWAMKNEWDKAIADFSKAITLNKNNYLAYHNRGFAWRNLENCDKAVDDYSEAIRINPDYADSYLARGSCYEDQNKTDLAIQDYLTATQKNPASYEAFFNLGTLEFNLNNIEKGLYYMEKVSEINPNMPEPHLYLGLIFLSKNQLSSTVKELGIYLKLSSNPLPSDLELIIKEEWNKNESQKLKMSRFEKDTGGFDMAKIEAQFICAYAYWEAGEKDNAKQILITLDSTLEFKTPTSASTKQFFNEMLTLIPADMAQDEEVKKVLGRLKGKVK